ncbi:PP2C family protein-serine/threonine phosphatase [Massilia sp. GCM10023247]|uniref:PP2C family protein-serine/threonine phosphatase n=1 Tax=Massilia sp. GCM10023247 TaxID=3252643 RepID=UPI003620D90B
MFEHLNFGPWLDVAARSALGAGPMMRAENQDNCVLIDAGGNAACLVDGLPQTRAIPGWPPGHVRLAVLDGMGGHGHGREAAEAAAAGLLAIPACHDVDTLSRHLERLHGELQRHFDLLDDPARPGTTLTLLELPAPGSAGALLWHAGDSRLYEITPGGALALSVDHVPATVLATAGLIGEDDWRRQVHGRHGSQIAQAFILGNTFTDPAHLDDGLFALTPEILPPWLRALPDRRALALRDDALYLLATDGFWSCADPARFVGRWPQLLAQQGAAGAIEALFGAMETQPPSGLQPDNLTAIALRLRHPGRDETALPQSP